MDDLSMEVICEKCGSPMKRIDKEVLRPIGMSTRATGANNATSGTSVERPIGVSGTSYPHGGGLNEASPKSIKIVKYVCHSCKWECQRIVD